MKKVLWVFFAIAVSAVAWVVFGVYRAERLFDAMESEWDDGLGIPRSRSAMWN